MGVDSLTDSQLSGWIHVAAVIGLNEIRSFLVVDDNLPYVTATTINAMQNYAGRFLTFKCEKQTGSENTKYVVGIREFKIWNQYKSPGEIHGSKYAPVSVNSPGLMFYLPMDESSGTQVTEIISNTKYPTAPNANSIYYWQEYDPQSVSNGFISGRIRKSVALALQSNELISFNISKSTPTYSDATIMFWIYLSTTARFAFSINSGTVFKLNINMDENPSVVSVYNYTEVKPRSKPIPENRWTSVVYVRSGGSYLIPAFRKFYINNVEVNTDQRDVAELVSDGYYITMQQTKDGQIASFKELKVLGMVLSTAEVQIEANRRMNPWDYAGYLRYYWPLDEYYGFKFYDYAINHVSGIYTTADADIGDPIGSKTTVASISPGKNNTLTWSSDAPLAICDQNEVYDIKQGKCFSRKSGLMFVRGKTHSISFQPPNIEQNFTIEFWILLTKTETDYQEILRNDHFIVRYEADGRFSSTFYNESQTTSTGYKAIPDSTSPTNTWTHIAITNSEMIGNSSIVINGIEQGNATFILINSAFSSYTVSHDSNGFTGIFRDFRVWNEFRSIGKIHLEMHNWQWHMVGMNFDLKGFYPINEGRGVTLYDQNPVTPANVLNFEANKAPLISPYWVRSDNLPILCPVTQFYDFSSNICILRKKVLKSTAAISLPIGKLMPFRDWSFHAWIRYTNLGNGVNIISVPNLFTVAGTGGNAMVTVTCDDTCAPGNTVTFTAPDPAKWYQLSIGYSYALNEIIVEHKLPAEIPTDPQDQPSVITGASTYYGPTEILLGQGEFMHIALWKKYLQTSRMEEAPPTSKTSQFMDPVAAGSLHPDLVSYWPLEESSGDILHDTSIYGSIKSLSSEFSSGKLSWIYDDKLEAKLLFAKHFQDVETGITGLTNKLIPKNIVCSSGCMYCATTDYCKSCIQGMYLKLGQCVATDSDTTKFERDLIEREYKYIRDSDLFGCNSQTCKVCDKDTRTVCDTAGKDCIRGSLYYGDANDCVLNCPAGSYKDTVSGQCKVCSGTPNCVECPSNTCQECETGYLLTKENTCKKTNCGDSVVDYPETCDDGNTVSGDGCSSLCLIEAEDFTCQMLPPNGPSICTPNCGDGHFYGIGGEECDSGSTGVGNGCDANCKIEVGWWCINGSPTTPTECFCSPKYIPALDVFENNYMKVKFQFSKPLALKTAVMDLCKSLFGTQVSLFGQTYSCALENDYLSITLGNDNQIYQGKQLTISGGILGSADCPKNTFSGSVTVPEIPMQNVYGEIEMNTQIPYCDKLPIIVKGIIGGLNRPYKSISLNVLSVQGTGSETVIVSNREMVNWKLTSKTKIDVSTYSFELPSGSLLPSATYNLQLTITNFQDVTYRATASFTSLSGLLINILISGIGAGNILPAEKSQDLVIRAIPQLTQCGVPYPDISDIAVNYTQLNINANNNLNISLLLDPTQDRVLHIPPNILTPGINYEIQVMCSSRTTNSSLATKNFIIQASYSKLMPIVHPISQISGEDMPLFISGSDSYDRIFCLFIIQKADNTNETTSYKWECEEGNCKFRNGTEISSDYYYTTPDLNLTENLFAPSSTMIWKFTISKGTRSSTAHANVTISSRNGPVIILEGPTKNVQQNDIIFIQAVSKRYPLSNYTFRWEIHECKEIPCYYAGPTKDFIRVNVSRVNPESDGTFGVEVFATDILTGSTGRAGLTIKIDPLPTLGNLVISPNEGDAWTTNFTITAKGFITADGKILYEFLYQKPGKTAFTSISVKSEAASIVTILPQGASDKEYLLPVAVRAYNYYGGYVMQNTTIKVKVPAQRANVLEQYEILKNRADSQDPSSILGKALLATSLLSDRVDTVPIPRPEDIPCNGQGTYANGKCICNPTYRARIDCSISDDQFTQESSLAGEILNDANKLMIVERSNDKTSAIAQVVVNIATKPDLLNTTTRNLARDLLEKTINETSSIDTEDLASAIDTVSVMSDISSIRQKEYTQVRKILDYFIELRAKNIDARVGNETIVQTFTNMKSQAAMLRGTYNVTLDMDNVKFPSTLSFLNNSDDYVTLHVIEWKTPIYNWAEDFSKVRSNIVSIELKDLKGGIRRVANIPQPINITFPLPVSTITARDLTALRCVYYENLTNMFSIEGLNFLSLDLDNGTGACQTTHLTDFAMSVPSVNLGPLPPPERKDPTIFGFEFNIYEIHKSPLFWFTIAVTVIFIYFWVWSYCKEKSENELVTLMRSRVYQEQKDFFNVPKTLPQHERLNSQSNSLNASQSVSQSASQAVSQNSNRSGGGSARERTIDNKDNKASRKNSQKSLSILDDVNKVENISPEKETFRRSMEEKKESLIAVPDETKKDNFDIHAEPIKGAEGSVVVPKKFKRRKKGKKHSKKPDKLDEKQLAIPMQNDSTNLDNMQQTNQPLGNDNNTSALALVLGKTESENHSSNEKGTFILFLVFF